MIGRDDIQNLLSGGATVVGPDGVTIGTVSEFYLDDKTGEPEWVTAATGQFGDAVSFVPLVEGSIVGNEVRVPYGLELVTGAPRFDDAATHLSEQEEADLYTYYGVSFSPVEAAPLGTAPAGTAPTSTAPTSTGAPADAMAGTSTMPLDTSSTPLDTSTSTMDTSTSSTGFSQPSPATSGTQGAAHSSVGSDTSALRSTPGLDETMTRFEEHLHVSTERVPTGTARLHKYVVTEDETVTVPVSHEEAHLERESITDANRDAATSDPDFVETDYEVTLTEERPVVEKWTVPVERVRLVKDTVTGEQTVTASIRTERIELDNERSSDPSSSSPGTQGHHAEHRKDDEPK